MDPLGESFRADLRSDARDAERLAEAARAYFTRRPEGAEDTDEDLVHRLRDPRVFGEFAATQLTSRRLRPKTRVELAQRSFDLLPLPRDEGDVILVESRAPAPLLAIADFLGSRDTFTVLHVLHLVYAVFLDRSLVTRASRSTRASVVSRVLPFSRMAEATCVLYVTMHLAVVPEAEARVLLRRILRSRAIPLTFKRTLAAMAVGDDGGRSEWVRLAQGEGLMSPDADLDSPAVIAGAPRLPPRLASAAKDWLAA